MQESPKPNSKNDLNPKFSYKDLVFDDAFTSENRKFVRFLVEAETPYYIEMLQYEYIQYQQLFFDKYNECLDNGKCACDETAPQFELIGNDKLLITVKSEEFLPEEEHEVEMPVYYVFGLPEAFKISMHREHDNTPDINLN